MTTTTITTTGDGTWVAPKGVSSVWVKCWGGGGGGGGAATSTGIAGGACGGCYAEKYTFLVVPGTTYNLHVATTRTATATSTQATNKGDVTWFSVNSSLGVVAIGGIGGIPAANGNTTGASTNSTSGSFGDTILIGGNGGAGTGSGPSGGGGGGAGDTAVGGNASADTAGTGGAANGGNGAAGKATDLAGGAGSNYGGGGGGARGISTGNKAGGTGAQGQIELIYSPVYGDVWGINQVAINRAVQW